jgi:O-antigen ligase
MIEKIKKLIEYSFLFFVFIFVFQTKLILFPAESNYNEISLYFNYFLLFFILVLFSILIFKTRKKGDQDLNLNFSSRHWVILAGLEFFAFLSIFVSAFQAVSVFKYILLLFAIALLFLMTSFKFDFKKVLKVFIIAIMIQAALGVFQFFTQESWDNKYLGLSSHDPAVLGTSVLENADGRLLRAYGATDHPNIFGALSFFAFAFLMILALKGDYSSKEKIIIYFSLALLLLALTLSFSRSAFLALIFSLFFWFVFFFFEKRKYLFKKFLPYFLFLLVFLFSFFLIFDSLIIDRFNFDSRLEKKSIEERSDQTLMSSEIIKENLFLGVGIGAYHQKLLDQNSDWKTYQAQPVHNVFLLVLSEIGIWGFIFFLLLLFYILKNTFSDLIYAPIFVGLLIFMFFDHWLWSLPFGLLFLFFIFSLTFYFKYDKVEDY